MPTRPPAGIVAVLLALVLGLTALVGASPASAEPPVTPAPSYVKYYIVAASYQGAPENLTEIAGRFLDRPTRSSDILKLNADVAQADGGRLTDPATLHVGWVLTLPWDAAGPAVQYGLPPNPTPAAQPAKEPDGSAPREPAAAPPPTGGCASSPKSYTGTKSPWAMRRVAPDHAWAHSRGRGVMVAVVDSGVDGTLPELAGHVTTGADITAGTSRGDIDCLGTGTAMAGIVAARPDSGGGAIGMAPDGKVMPVRIARTSATVAEADQANAIEVAVSAGVKVIALGGYVDLSKPAVASAVERATGHDVLVVTGAPGATGSLPASDRVWAGLLRVGAINIDGAPAMAYRPGTVDVVAPGVDVASLGISGTGRVRGTGTPYAVAFVAGEAALVRSKYPHLTAAQVAGRIEATADRREPNVPDATLGWGLINPGAAVTRTIPDEGRDLAGGWSALRTLALIVVAVLALVLVLLLVLRIRRMVRAASLADPGPATDVAASARESTPDVTNLDATTPDATTPDATTPGAVAPESAAGAPDDRRQASTVGGGFTDERDQVLSRTISLTEMLLGGDPLTVDITEGWEASTAERLLRVPIGNDGDGEPVILDIKESAQGGSGPHGLIVGATGSGKSELLRTLVTGLSLTHSPELLGFVLIDFKGGAAFAPLTDLPHVAGLITNLADDSAMIDRVQSALIGEQQRRQRMLRSAGNLGSIRDYQRRRASGAVGVDGQPLEPMPYLVIIVDEFSELLSGRPEFVDLFVQIGRMGPGLGLHLLLATQRLEEGRLGGLDSHLSYRIWLRTFSAAASRTVIGTTDAYRPELGPADPPAPDEPDEPDESTLTELAAVVGRLQQIGRPVHQVWLPPLPRTIPLDNLTGAPAARPGRGLAGRLWPGHGELSVPIGVLDLPLLQQQQPLTMDFAGTHGHLALVGAPQTGRSTFLRALMLSGMLTHTPGEMQFACIDFGGGSLHQYAVAPHVTGVAGPADLAMASRMLAEVRALIQEREALFRDLGIDAIAEFRARRASGRLPVGLRTADVFLLVDNWSGLRAELEEVDEAVADIAGRGLGVGVHLVLTASRWTEIRPALRDSIGTRVELRLNDPSESEVSRALAARMARAVPGRGIATPGVYFHLVLPRLDGQETAEGIDKAQDDVLKRIAAAWTGAAAPPVRMLSDHIGLDRVLALPRTRPGIPVGVAEADLGPVLLDLAGGDPHFLVYGDAGSGKTSFLRTFIGALAALQSPWETRIVLCDYRRSVLDAVPDDYLGAYAPDAEATRAYVEQVVARLAERLPPAGVTAAELAARSWWEGPEIYLVIDDYDLVGAAVLAPLVIYLPYAREVGLHVVLARRITRLDRTAFEDQFVRRIQEQGCAGLVLSGDHREGTVLGDERATQRPPGRGVLVRRGEPGALIQVALVDAATGSATRRYANGHGD